MLRDLLGDRATGELMEELNDLFEQLKVLGWKEIRPWGEFFGDFKPPEMKQSLIEDRVTTNFLHYRSNYAVICAVLLLLQVFLSPMLIVAVPLAVTFCCYILIVHKKTIKIGDIVITDSHKQTACAIFCLFFFAITGILERLVWIIIYCIFTIGLHLILRPRNISSKANRVYEEMKLNGYTNWFSGGSSTGGPSPHSSKLPDIDTLDPENPAIHEPETTNTVPSYGYSSNLHSTAVDMRKRGHPGSSSGNVNFITSTSATSTTASKFE